MKKTALLAAAVLTLGISSAGTALAQTQSTSGLMTIKSKNSAADTVTKLDAAIKAKGMKVFTHIDHAAAATEAGLSMPFSTVVIFGNPKAGTPNLLKKPTLAIDLPLKALVWQDSAGQVFVTYNSGGYVLGTIFGRHGLKPPEKAKQGQEALLSGLAAEAAM